MKKISLALFLLVVLAAPLLRADDDYGGYESSSSNRRGFSVGFGPIGNIFLIDTLPIMDPGIGGHVFFDYRFHQNVAFETSFFISNQEGANVSKPDGSILLLGMPTFDIKYYYLNHSKWDPYFSTGVGFYMITEGDSENSTGGVGLGAQLGVGLDYRLTELVSFGLQGTFRSISFISSTGTPSNSRAVFPYSLQANVAFHF
ncbi:MAG: outer membrane beta-barrel protein [bacterium]|nr:outer membrane beta-barrel protein [bacterium]